MFVLNAFFVMLFFGADLSPPRLGVRHVTLTHAFTNLLCDSSSGDIKWHGLSDAGREVVVEMGRLGMVPDITHATDQAALQALALSRGPVVATHSNARALCCPLPEMARALGAESLEERNLSDDMIRHRRFRLRVSVQSSIRRRGWDRGIGVRPFQHRRLVSPVPRYGHNQPVHLAPKNRILVSQLGRIQKVIKL